MQSETIERGKINRVYQWWNSEWCQAWVFLKLKWEFARGKDSGGSIPEGDNLERWLAEWRNDENRE